MLSETFERLRNKKSRQAEIFEITDLDNFAQNIDLLRPLTFLNYEVALIYTDESRWLLITGGEMSLQYSPTKKGTSLAVAQRIDYPSITDLRFYAEHAKQSLILTEDSVTVISKPLKNLWSGKDLKTYEFVFSDSIFLYWYDMGYRKIKAGDERTPSVAQVDDKGYLQFLEAIGTDLKIFPWENASLAANNLGGIDLTASKMDLDLQNDGRSIQFRTDPAMLRRLQNASGFTPVIINIQPLNDIRLFLGLKDAQKPQKYGQS